MVLSQENKSSRKRKKAKGRTLVNIYIYIYTHTHTYIKDRSYPLRCYFSNLRVSADSIQKEAAFHRVKGRDLEASCLN